MSGLSEGISMNFAFRGPMKSVPFSECLRDLIGVPLIESALYTNLEPIPRFNYSHLLRLGKLKRMTNRNCSEKNLLLSLL